MRSLAWALLVCGGLLPTSVHAAETHVIDVSTADQLLEALREPADGTTVRLAPGAYRLFGMQYTTTLWDGDTDQERSISVGVVLSGESVSLIGADDGVAEIVTDAGWGVLFDGCSNCAMEGVAIRGYAKTERGGKPTLVVSAGSSVRIKDCAIRADTTSSQWIRGLMSTNRSLVTIDSSEITGVWLGIVLYEESDATITNCLIRGRDLGAGLVLERKAATLRRSHLDGFAYGVLIQGSADLTCEANIIENMRHDGLNGLEHAPGRLRIEKNVFYHCGGAGIAVRADGDQQASGNLVVATGSVKPRQSAIYVIGAKADAALRKNTLYDNTVLDASLDRDVPREIFWRKRRPWTRTYRNTRVGVDGRHHFYESAFLTRYGRWSN